MSKYLHDYVGGNPESLLLKTIDDSIDYLLPKNPSGFILGTPGAGRGFKIPPGFRGGPRFKGMGNIVVACNTNKRITVKGHRPVPRIPIIRQVVRVAGRSRRLRVNHREAEMEGRCEKLLPGHIGTWGHGYVIRVRPGFSGVWIHYINFGDTPVCVIGEATQIQVARHTKKRLIFKGRTNFPHIAEQKYCPYNSSMPIEDWILSCNIPWIAEVGLQREDLDGLNTY